jgi:hypothetical protein
MKINKKLFIVGILLVISTMIMATQFAVTKLGYEFNIVHPSNANIRLIGSDNSSDGIRILRVDGDNTTRVTLKLRFGNLSANQTYHYSAAFGIVNEERFPLNITYIEVSSPNVTYMKIWLHGNRDANANNTANDPSSTFMYNNGTIVNGTNTTRWILAAGNENPNEMCSNVSDRTNYTIPTPWENTAHVRYSLNETNATSGVSDFVWVQVSIEIDEVVDFFGTHTGTIYIHFEAENTI